MDNLWNAVLGEVDGQIRIFWNIKIFVHPREAIDDALLRLSVHTTPISFLTILDRDRYVYEEEIVARGCLMRDRLTNGLPSCIVRSNRCRDHRCTRARELSRNKPYPLQMIVALFPRKGMVCVKPEPSVEIELARLVIRSLLVQYLSFSSTLMLSSMHHIDTHIF